MPTGTHLAGIILSAEHLTIDAHLEGGRVIVTVNTAHEGVCTHGVEVVVDEKMVYDGLASTYEEDDDSVEWPAAEPTNG